MAIPKKGSRKITVDGIVYRWRVSSWRKITEWRPATAGLVDSRWLERAREYGLGDVADVTFTIAVELFERPASRILTTYYALVVDGFLGIEQFTQISPRLVRMLIDRAVDDGWQANEPEDFRMNLIENSGSPLRPGLLVLPGMDAAPNGYEDKIIPVTLVWSK